MVDYLIKNEHASPNQLALVQSIRQPALCLATRLDNCHIVKALLLKHGAQSNVMDSARMTPLHLAAKNDCSECVKQIHSAAVHSEANFQSNLSQKDAEGQTPLIIAIRICKIPENKNTSTTTDNSSGTKAKRGQVVETLLHLGSDP